MHEQLIDWLTRLKRDHPHAFHDRRVLEGGSMDVNGSPRPFFEGCEYIGVDWREGPGVDVVSLIHDYDGGPFDTVISTETLEHDPYHAASLRRLVELVRPGGSLIISAAGPGRTKHRLDHAPDGRYYANVEPTELIRGIWRISRFRSIHLEINMEHNDVYVFCDGKIQELAEGAVG